MSDAVSIRAVSEEDAAALYQLELACFDSDRLSLRSIKHWIKASNRIFIVAEGADGLLGYALVLLHRGTRLARLYSLAVAERARGMGIGKQLMHVAEKHTADKGRLFMRLEVALDNYSAIRLYQSLGYVAFGTYSDYYEDHRDALRMQKRIRYIEQNLVSQPVPWYRQTTEFTCGPASLMMAMASLDPESVPSQLEELDIWREATTIFMTSGLGGSHPLGLAIAARRRGYQAEVLINQSRPLFLESVRNPRKKRVLSVVDAQFRAKAVAVGVKVTHADVTQAQIAAWLRQGAAVLVLISTYRMDGKKAPHWVAVAGMDDWCLYVHDPDPSEGEIPFDCQNVPIARADFEKMSTFGRERLRTALVLRKA